MLIRVCLLDNWDGVPQMTAEHDVLTALHKRKRLACPWRVALIFYGSKSHLQNGYAVVEAVAARSDQVVAFLLALQLGLRILAGQLRVVPKRWH